MLQCPVLPGRTSELNRVEPLSMFRSVVRNVAIPVIVAALLASRIITSGLKRIDNAPPPLTFVVRVISPLKCDHEKPCPAFTPEL